MIRIMIRIADANDPFGDPCAEFRSPKSRDMRGVDTRDLTATIKVKRDGHAVFIRFKKLDRSETRAEAQARWRREHPRDAILGTRRSA